jgi:predicted transcriptional regulator
MIRVPAFVAKFGDEDKGTLLTEADTAVIKDAASESVQEVKASVNEVKASVDNVEYSRIF